MIERFWTKVAKSEECWLWQAATSEGYGVIAKGEGGRGNAFAHRVSWEMANGPIPPGLTIDHLCRVRHCVRPSHLDLVPIRINTLRGVGPTAINAAKTHCPRGHQYDDKNTYVCKLGKRYCRQCQLARYHARRRAALTQARGETQ